MSTDIQLIINEIEIRRKELTECGQDFNDPEMIKRSQQLDELINQYYRMLDNLNRKKRAVI